MILPRLNLRRVFLIARRDFIGYVKTWGFWISFFLPFIFAGMGLLASLADISVQPVRYETILDDTGLHAAKIIQKDIDDRAEVAAAMLSSVGAMGLSKDDRRTLRKTIEDDGLEAGRAYLDTKIPGAGQNLKVPESKTRFIDPPAGTLAELQPYLRGDKLVVHNGTEVNLSGVLHLYESTVEGIESDETRTVIKADYWSSNINNNHLKSIAINYFSDAATSRYLKSGGLSRKGLNAASKGILEVETYDPTKTVSEDGASQIVTTTDRIPYIVAAILAGALWLTIFAGSYMLLTSMLEEKLNKLLEMMLASTRFSEIMFGKLLGAAALTVTAMGPYIVIGILSVIGLIISGPPEIAAGLKAAFSAKMLIFFFIYLVLGYVFYGAFFIALGALAESAQDAQTLTTPIMLILTVCFMVVPLGLSSPDSPIIEYASWFPLSAPFAAIIKLASDPPLWELALSAFFLFVCVLGVVWLAGRIFRFGVLSGSGVKSGWENIKVAMGRKRLSKGEVRDFAE